MIHTQLKRIGGVWMDDTKEIAKQLKQIAKELHVLNQREAEKEKRSEVMLRDVQQLYEEFLKDGH